MRVVSSNEININGLDAMGGDTTSRGLDVVVSSEAEATASASSSTRSSGQSSLVEQSKPIKRASIGPSRVTVSTSQLVIRGPNGKLLLMVDEANVVLATDKLRVNSESCPSTLLIDVPFLALSRVQYNVASSLPFTWLLVLI